MKPHSPSYPLFTRWNRSELHARLGEVSTAAAPRGGDLRRRRVEDGSMENGSPAVRADPRVRGVQFRRRYGKSALGSGGARACHRRLPDHLDADLQDDPAEIPRLLDKLTRATTWSPGGSAGGRSLLKRAARESSTVSRAGHRRETANDIQLRLKAYRARSPTPSPSMGSCTDSPGAGAEGRVPPRRDRREAPSAQVRRRQVRRVAIRRRVFD